MTQLLDNQTVPFFYLFNLISSFLIITLHCKLLKPFCHKNIVENLVKIVKIST